MSVKFPFGNFTYWTFHSTELKHVKRQGIDSPRKDIKQNLMHTHARGDIRDGPLLSTL